MVNCYKCEKCGKVFTDYEEAYKHENEHYTVKRWFSCDDEEVMSREVEYSEKQSAPSGVVVPLERTIYNEETSQWENETIYIRFYADKRTCEQVFPINKALLSE